MDMKFELVPVPVSNIDRAKAFYVDQVGFHEDHDVRPNDTVRIVQLTPPGSGCSIVLGMGLAGLEMQAGSLRGLHLVVGEITKARDILISRGIDVSEVDEPGGGVKFAGFSDPDGNTWVLQEMAWRASEF